jgi:hypothetical protein
MEESKQPFRYELRSRGAVVELELFGYVDADSAQRYLADVEAMVEEALRTTGGSTVGLMLHGSVSGFDASRTAQLHGEWFRKMGGRLSRIAIVSSRTRTTLAISVLRLGTRHPMKQFDTPEEALRWLAS